MAWAKSKPRRAKQASLRRHPVRTPYRHTGRWPTEVEGGRDPTPAPPHRASPAAWRGIAPRPDGIRANRSAFGNAVEKRSGRGVRAAFDDRLTVDEADDDE